MGIVVKIKNTIGSYLLKKDLQKLRRNRKPNGFNNIKTIGILYVVPHEQDYPHIVNFVKYFQDNNKIVKALGFTNTEYIPHYCFPKLTYDYFTKKNINWFGKPSHKFVDDFVNTEYDLLIDLQTSENFTISYIGYTSIAKFKMGMNSSSNLEHYDLMMTVQPDIELSEYLSQIIHYLTNINISTNE